jgi:hypothetical protein
MKTTLGLFGILLLFLLMGLLMRKNQTLTREMVKLQLTMKMAIPLMSVNRKFRHQPPVGAIAQSMRLGIMRLRIRG